MDEICLYVCMPSLVICIKYCLQLAYTLLVSGETGTFALSHMD